jgi:hypothetical protein
MFSIITGDQQNACVRCGKNFVSSGSQPENPDVCSHCDNKVVDSSSTGHNHLELRQEHIRKPLNDFSISKLTESENQKNINQQNSYESYKLARKSPYGYLTTSPFDNVQRKHTSTTSNDYHSHPEVTQPLVQRKTSICRIITVECSPTTDSRGSSPVSTLCLRSSCSVGF